MLSLPLSWILGLSLVLHQSSVSILRATFDAALKFWKEDTRAGAEPIIKHQSVSNLLTNIKIRCDASRMLVWKACDDLNEGKGAELAVEAKVFCSQSAVKSVNEAMAAVGM